MSIMKDVLELLITNLVEDKAAVKVNQIDSEKSIVFEVRVAESDMGKVIGRQGKIAKSIRTVMKALAAKENKKITIEFIG